MNNEQVDNLLCSFADDPNCPESWVQMLAAQEDDDTILKDYLALLRARLSNYPRHFNVLLFTNSKQGSGWYVVTNYDYDTYKWFKNLGLSEAERKTTANKLYIRCSALPMRVMKQLEEKLDGTKA